MKRLFYALSSLIVFFSFFSCGDTTDIGNSLLTDQVEIIMDSSFMSSAASNTADAYVQSRTTVQLLGIIEAPEYGNFTSEFVTQFMPAGQIDTAGISVNDIDSLKLIMAVPRDGYVGDSVTPMGMEIFLLNKELPSPIYSNFDPSQYYDPSSPIASIIYANNTLMAPDSVAELNYRFITVDMPLSLGRSLYQMYLDNPSTYLSPESFTRQFKGLYVRNSFGSGRVVRIESSLMRLFWHTIVKASDGSDSIVPYYGNYYAVTPEIITNNIMDYSMSASLHEMINSGKAIIAAPTGSDVTLNFPAQTLVDTYRKGSGAIAMVNDLEISLPAKTITNNYGINPPPYLLMVRKSEKNNFFKSNTLPDNETSFYAAYNSTTKSYKFTGMRNYMLWLLNKDKLTPDDYTFTLTPVTLGYGTNNNGYYGSSSYLETVSPYVQEPAMAEIIAENAKIIFTFSRQSKK